MDNEKYGIELDLIIDKFKSKIQKVKKDIGSISKVQEIKYDKEGMRKAPVGEWKKWTQQTVAQTKAVGKLNDNYTELNTSSSKFSSGIEKGLKKSVSTIKRFGLSLLGIRSIWALVSRASSAYLSQDTELANKLQSVWAGLGAMLAPIIEGIVNILMKAVKYINIFIKALTGVDMLARASAKSMNSTAKAAKGLNKALAGFDELQNLDTDTGGGDTGVTNPFKGIQDVEINTEWADKIRRFGEWMRDNWQQVINGFITFGLILGAMKLGKFLSSLEGVWKIISKSKETLGKFLKVIGANAQLIGGLLIAVIGIIGALNSIIDYIKDPSWENFGKTIQYIGLAILGFGIAFGAIPAIIIGAIVLIVGTVIKYWDKIKETLQKGIDWLVSKTDWVKNKLGVFAGAIYEIFLHQLQVVLDLFDIVFTTMKKEFDGIIKFFKGVFTGDWEQIWEGIKQIFTSKFEGIKQVVKKVWEYILNLFSAGGKIFDGIKEGIVNVFKMIINHLISGINRVISIPFNRINGILNQIKGIDIFGARPFDGLWGWNPLPVPQIPQLNVGTNYVPEDQLAMIHKGEAVIPKKFNNEEYFGRNNEETNSKLDDLIEAVRSIEINPYTTIKDVGKASVSYINSKSRQLGESVIY